MDNKYTFQQKIFIISLILVTFIILSLGFYQIAQNIRNPFIYKEQYKNIGKGGCNEPTEIQKKILMNRDTDGDGLSDYDELYKYHTSPFLKDSDSDGIDDKKEIENKTDPNCPEGKNCFSNDLTNPTIQEKNKSLELYNNIEKYNKQLEQMNKQKQGVNIGSSTNSGFNVFENNNYLNSEQLNLLNGKADAKTIKKFLKAAGVDSKLLDKLSDKEIMDAYKKTLNKTTGR